MLKKYCDRCLKEIDGIKSEMMSISNGNNTVYYDLCEGCHAEMWECLLKKKAEYMAERETDQPCPPPPMGVVE